MCREAQTSGYDRATRLWTETRAESLQIGCFSVEAVILSRWIRYVISLEPLCYLAGAVMLSRWSRYVILLCNASFVCWAARFLSFAERRSQVISVYPNCLV